MESTKITISKLKGALNYEVWALRTDALLTKEGLREAITSSETNISEEANNKALANIKLLVH
jgi:hypothetical protein